MPELTNAISLVEAIIAIAANATAIVVSVRTIRAHRSRHAGGDTVE